MHQSDNGFEQSGQCSISSSDEDPELLHEHLDGDKALNRLDSSTGLNTFLPDLIDAIDAIGLSRSVPFTTVFRAASDLTLFTELLAILLEVSDFTSNLMDSLFAALCLELSAISLATSDMTLFPELLVVPPVASNFADLTVLLVVSDSESDLMHLDLINRCYRGRS